MPLPARWLPLALLGTLIATGTSHAGKATAPPEPPPVGLAQLHRLDLLPAFRTSVQVGSVSSYDRTGGNDDGFSGRHSFLRKEGDGLVIADLKGPGAIYRVWTPTPTDDPIEFYFDGEPQPRIRLKFRELFDGTKPPFVSPVVGFGSGGFWSYLPLPYRQSCKVVIRAPRVQFYQINYATYPEGARVETFRPEASPAFAADLQKAQEVLNATGTDLSRYLVPEGTKLTVNRTRKRLAPGKEVSLFKHRKGGRIVGLRLRPASAFMGKDRALSLAMYWEGAPQPAVSSPAGDFFGFSWGDPAARSLLVGTSGDTCYAYFPMPFERSAEIRLASARLDGTPVDIEAEIVTADLPKRADEGRFYAYWRRENPTTDGKPFTFLDTTGRGHVVGVALQAQGKVSGNTYFFEGDDQATIDGELVAHGTGSEDFFNGGWYDVPGRWESRVSFPLNGCLDYKKALGRTGAYRLFLTDAYAYRQRMLLTIEHAPEKNALAADYAGVTYFYAETPPAAPELPALAARRVEDFDKLVYTPGWNVPIQAFSFRGGTLVKKTERIGNEEVRYLSMRAEGTDLFGDHHLALLCEIPTPGRYRVSIEALQGPEGGQVRLYQNERAMGETVDLYAAQRAKSKPLPMGAVELKQGDNPLFFKLQGKNPQSTAMGFDLVTLQLERLP